MNAVFAPAALAALAALLLTVLAPVTVEAKSFRCGGKKYLRKGDTAEVVREHCGTPLLVTEGIDRRGDSVRFWRYLSDREALRSGGVLQFHSGKLSGWAFEQFTWYKCNRQRAALGDDPGVTVAKCGQPAHIQNMSDARGVAYQEWMFVRRSGSRRDPIVVLTFVKDTLVAVEERRSR